jgi:2-hydroxychromene-2-carboxylate isomerase
VTEPILVAIDFKSPAAYLAVEPIRALESRLRQVFDCYRLRSRRWRGPKPAAPEDDRGIRHARIRAEYLANDLRRYAASRGLDLGDLYREPDTDRAARPALAGSAAAPPRSRATA